MQTFGTKALGKLATRLTRDALRDHNTADIELTLAWEEIVGRDLALNSKIEKISFQDGEGVLWLKVTPILAMEVQYMIPQLLSRMNTHLGYKAIKEIRIKQGKIN